MTSQGMTSGRMAHFICSCASVRVRQPTRSTKGHLPFKSWIFFHHFFFPKWLKVKSEGFPFLQWIFSDFAQVKNVSIQATTHTSLKNFGCRYQKLTEASQLKHNNNLLDRQGYYDILLDRQGHYYISESKQQELGYIPWSRNSELVEKWDCELMGQPKSC